MKRDLKETLSLEKQLETAKKKAIARCIVFSRTR